MPRKGGESRVASFFTTYSFMSPPEDISDNQTLTLKYCPILRVEVPRLDPRSRFADCFDLLISSASEARFSAPMVLEAGAHLTDSIALEAGSGEYWH